MAARFAEPAEEEIVALLEKAIPENTKKQLNMELRFWQVYENEEIFQVIINSKQTLKYSYKAPVFVSRNSEADCFVICGNK